MQKTRKVPLRKCVGCQEMKPKPELVRVVHTPEDEVVLDFKGKRNGRGAYLCKKLDCLKIAQKRKSLERALKTTIPDDVYQELLACMEGAIQSDGIR